MNEFHAQKCVTQTKRRREQEKERTILRASASTCSMQLGTHTQMMNMLWHTFCSWKTFRANLQKHKYVCVAHSSSSNNY